ncbi:hypothetical protein ACROYT_G006932 [Oculina patagonica]
MAEHSIGSTRTVVVDVKYVSSTNLVAHTENYKLDIPLNCSVKELEKTLIRMCGVENFSKRRGFADFSVDIFYIDLVEPGHPRKAPFVLRTQEQLEMFKNSETLEPTDGSSSLNNEELLIERNDERTEQVDSFSASDTESDSEEDTDDALVTTPSMVRPTRLGRLRRFTSRMADFLQSGK